VSAARAWAVASLIVVASWHPARATAQAPPARISRERVTFKSDGLTLVGFLFQPDGPGPFPGLVWNHGSEKKQGHCFGGARGMHVWARDVLAFFAGAVR
jgi:dipeptidyl aminopeptidase/acylaminoacyl peptidase